MCRVGYRCYPDSYSKLEAAEKRLASIEESIESCERAIKEAARSNDLEAYSKAREQMSALSEKKQRIIFDRNSAQRDVDGTKKGQAIIQEAMMNCKTAQEFEALRLRKNQGEATAFVRAYSAKYKKSKKQSPIFLPGEKKPARRLTA